jgi:nucleotide-binding universal stress UspA family protein
MPTVRRILVGLDGSPLAETILPVVEALAAKLEAAVTLLHVLPVPEHEPAAAERPGVDRLVEHATQQASEYLSGVQRRLASAGVDVSPVVAVGTPAREIVRHAQGGGFDLVALATHGRSGLQQWIHGSVADQVLHTTTIPLLLVRPGDGWAAVPRGIRRIVVPLDGSTEAEAALRLAEPVALRCGLPLALVQFIEPLNLEFAAGPSGTAYVGAQRIMDELLGAAHEYLTSTADGLRARGLTVTTEVSVARPAAGINDYTREHPESLVVLTTHGRSGWRRLLLGSVARRVVLTVAAPILVCPLRGAEEGAR